MAARAEPLPGRHSLPSTSLPALRGAARRTTVLRILLGVALLAALAAAFVAARSRDAQHAPLLPAGTTGVVVLDVSASIGAQSFQRVEQALRGLARSDQGVGLVVFSDSAYEMLPPGSPSRELERLFRFFRPMRGRGADAVFPVNPWADDFRAGTRISVGLRAAREALTRQGIEKGSVVLISDLDSPATDVTRLGAEIDDLRREGYELRVVPVFPIKEKLALFESLIGTGRLAKTTTATAPVRAPEGTGIRGALPWAFVLIALTLIALLALNERANARLMVPKHGRPHVSEA
jgi:von Willebrand factor type A domain